MSTYKKKIKVSDEHTFFVCGGVIQEDQFVALLKRIQTNLINLYPGQGFENVKWRYSIKFKDLTELDDLLTNYETEDTLSKLIGGFEEIKSENLSNGDSKTKSLDFIEDLYKNNVNWRFEESKKYLHKLFKDTDEIKYGTFDIKKLIKKVIAEKKNKFFKAENSGNVGYLWVSDPRVFDYLRMDSPFNDVADYLSYLLYNDYDRFKEYENYYEKLLQSNSSKDAVNILNDKFKEAVANKEIFKLFTYEYNSDQSFHFDDLIRSNRHRCGPVLAYTYTTGYVEFKKATIKLSDNKNKKYLIASIPQEVTIEEFNDDYTFRENLVEKIGIFDVNIHFTEKEIILENRTKGKNGLIFFDAIYGKGFKETRFIDGEFIEVIITKSVVKVKDSKNNTHELIFKFVNSLDEFYGRQPTTVVEEFSEYVVQQPGKTAKKRANEAKIQQNNISSKPYNQTPNKGKQELNSVKLSDDYQHEINEDYGILGSGSVSSNQIKDTKERAAALSIFDKKTRDTPLKKDEKMYLVAPGPNGEVRYEDIYQVLLKYPEIELLPVGDANYYILANKPGITDGLRKFWGEYYNGLWLRFEGTTNEYFVLKFKYEKFNSSEIHQMTFDLERAAQGVDPEEYEIY